MTGELLGVQPGDFDQDGFSVQVEPVVEDVPLPARHGSVGPAILPLGDNEGGGAGVGHAPSLPPAHVPGPGPSG